MGCFCCVLLIQELIEALKLPEELKLRVWSIFPRPLSGATPLFVNRPDNASELAVVDPWALLEHLPQLPSDEVVVPLAHKTPRRSRRVYRCAA